MTHPLPSYLKERKALIHELGPQKLPRISRSYLGWDQPLMKRLYGQFPDSSIQRTAVTKLYEDWDDPAYALITTLVWGMIDTKKKQRLQQVLAVSEAELGKRLEGLQTLVSEGELEGAFLSCCQGGENHIPGIGPSYFTKVFFFMGQAKPSLKPKPLIFDKWTTNAFFALHGQNVGSQVLRSHFHFPSEKSLAKYRAVPLKADINLQAEAYRLYTDTMNSWAGQMEVLPDKLEQFVFGIDLRTDKSPTNPRNELLAIIRALTT